MNQGLRKNLGTNRCHTSLELEATTQFDFEEFTFRWKLKVPSFVKQSLLSPLESPIFVGGESAKHSWQLRWRRSQCSGSGRTTYSYYQVELFLVGIGGDPSPTEDVEDQRIQALGFLSYKDLDEKSLLESRKENATANFRDICVGQQLMSSCINEADICGDEAGNTKGLLTDDGTLTIYCRVAVYMGVKSSAVFKNSIGLNGTLCTPSTLQLTQEVEGMKELAMATRRALISTEYADVKLITATKTFPAHKVILAARSPVFAAMFRSNMLEATENLVEIKDFEDDVVEAMLDYIYTGQIVGSAKFGVIVSDVLVMADKYDLLSLKSQCEEYISGTINAENAVGILQWANLHSAKLLKASAIQFIIRNKDKVCKEQCFKQIADPTVFIELFMHI